MGPIVPTAINWLWQASLLTLSVAFIVRISPRLSASTRERIWWMTLCGNLALLVAPFAAGPASGSASVVDAAPPIVLPPMGRWPAIVGLVWVLWIVMHVVRLGVGMGAVVRATRRTSPFPAERESRLTVWNEVRSTQPAVRLAVSPVVRHAAVLGWRRPIIAMAPETLATLNDREIDQVLVHEFAHIQRRDAWALLVQRGIHAVVGFHPAVWWLDRAITLERERACDDFVLAAGGSPKQYGACLLKLVAVSHGIPLAPGAALARGELTRRIGYLLEPGRNRSLRGSRRTIATSVAVVTVLTFVCASNDLAAYSRRVTAAIQLDIVLPGSRVPPPVSIASPPLMRHAGSDHPTPAANSRIIPGVEDRIRPLNATEFGVQVPVAAPEQPLPFVEGRTVTGHLSLPVAPAAEPLDLSRDAPEENVSSAASVHTPWQALADAGKAVGAGTRRAGVGTGRAFSRFGRSLAGVF